MFLIPPTHVFVTWVCNLVPGSLNLLLGTACYLVLDRSLLSENEGGRVGRRKDFVRFLAAEAMLMMSLLIYPPTALVILVFTTTHLAFSPLENWPRVRRRVVRDLVFVGSGMVAYYVFVKGYVHFIEHSEANLATVEWIVNHSPYKFALTKDIGMTLQKLYDISLFSMSGVWCTAFGLVAGWGVLALLLGGGIYVGVAAFRRAGIVSPSNQEGLTPWRRTIWLAQTLILGTIVFVVSVAPFLAAAKCECLEPVGYRIMFVPMAIVVVLTMAVLHSLAACWRGTRKASLAAIGVAILMTGSVFLSGRHIALIAGNCCMEYNYLRQRLLSVDLSKVRECRVRAHRSRRQHDRERPPPIRLQLHDYGYGHARADRARGVSGPGAGFRAMSCHLPRTHAGPDGALGRLDPRHRHARCQAGS